ncbi:MAG: hypothetical protein BMS9Abin34_317 [Patescibacteria group bacterium]|nr:MAG: hypothetical protein BMS9Abin34_317 [Patescibacteria group bacterium]
MFDTTEDTVPRIKLREIRYWLGWLSKSFATGMWNSYFLGRGFDFQGIVPFRDDPDLVRINWQATLTSNELQVSTFSEERNARIYLLANLGPSMAFGSRESKLERLAVISALLSFSAYRFKDYFRFIGYTDMVEVGFPEPRDRSYPLILAESILDFDWKGKKRGGLVRAASKVGDQKALVVMISDQLGKLDGTEAALKILASRHDVLPIILWDEREVRLPAGFGVLPLQDLETGEFRHILLTPRVKRRFEEDALERRRELEDLFGRYGCSPFFLTEEREEDFKALMKIFLARRAGV